MNQGFCMEDADTGVKVKILEQHMYLNGSRGKHSSLRYGNEKLIWNSFVAFFYLVYVICYSVELPFFHYVHNTMYLVKASKVIYNYNKTVIRFT